MTSWYSRPVFFVEDLPASLDFYTEMLSFTKAWSYEGNDQEIVAQVTRGDCEIILAVNTERAGGSRLFISLEADEVQVLEEEIKTRSIPHQRTWWGYPVIEIKDPDTNELLFPVEE